MVFLLFPSLAMADSLLNEANKCKTISSRLERLDCFDAVFNTETTVLEKTSIIKPEVWTRAFSSEMNREVNDNHPLTSLSHEKEQDIWVTIPSIDRSRPEAVLMFSCIDNISRIDVALKQKIELFRIEMASNSFPSSLWKIDDTGFVLSSARGLTAIELMKKIASQSQLVLESTLDDVNGLSFDTTYLANSLKPLRLRCRW